MKFDYQRFFPYPSVRAEQEVSIAFALDAFLNCQKKFVVLELGTGVGKSAVGMTVGRYIDAEPKKDDAFKPGMYALTTQKVLQEQYVNDFGPPSGNLISIKSAANFQCEFYPNNTCSESLGILKNEKKGTQFWRKCTLDCCYKRQKARFLESHEGITNFSYFLAETMYGGKITPRELLVVDEAHCVEEELSKFVEVVVSERFMSDVLKLSWPDVSTERGVFEWLRDVYCPTLSMHIARVEAMIAKFKLEEKIKEFESIAKQYDMLDKHVCKLHRFLEMWSDDNWIMNVIPAFGRSKRKLEFKPVDVGPYSHDLLFRFGRRVLMMSATIINRDVFCDTLGIDKSDVAFLSIDSPFPVQNRPIVYAPVGNMSMGSADQTLPGLVEMIKLILQQHKGEKGIIHARSFKIANYIKKNIRSSRLIIHDSTNREEVIKKHFESSKDTVIISPSLTEGIDLKDDLSRFQILCKVPYPYLGDKLSQRRMKKRKLWYPYQTARSVVQSVGRSVRNEHDHAVTYILDSSWERFYRQNSDMFPNSFKSALQG